MKTWYYGCCDEHKEFCRLYVDNPICTLHYLGDMSTAIQKWLGEHYGCALRLFHLDQDLDYCYDNGYKKRNFPKDPVEELSQSNLTPVWYTKALTDSVEKK